ncbi:MAG: histidine phosphatase family protein [Clostridia bacterium]|nr:histidine phosphatase family protein [Clostridia bacterium]
MTKIILVRHAECEGNVTNSLTGRTDFKLTQKGREMAQKLAEELKKYNIDAIYSSTSVRCVETVTPIAKYLKLDIITSKELMEKYFGIYDGMTWEEVNKINPLILENKNKYNEIMGIPNQETSKELKRRMNEYIKKISQQNDEKTILICSHGCAIFSFLNCVKYIQNVEERSIYSQSNASINILEYKNGEFKILKINQTEHLT